MARWTGHPAAFSMAAATIVIWGISGPVFDFSDTWQLVINTGTTIITFLMVFLIQSTQNTDTAAIHLKLDELLRATKGAHTVLMDLEELSESELAQIRKEYVDIAAKGRKALASGKTDSGNPRVKLQMEKSLEKGEQGE